jgi:uncharacterized membrane protein
MTTAEQSSFAPSRPLLPTLVKRAAVLALIALVLATMYVHEAYVLNPRDPLWAHLAPFRWWLIPHIAGGVTALLLGPLQFSSSLRRWSLPLHRWLGRLYVLAALVSSSLSVYIVLTFEAPVNHWVMGTMGGLWFFTTLFAWLAAWNGAIAQHRLWIGRSYGLTFTFVTTRFIPDVIFPGLDYYDTTALYWLLIVAALLLPDLVIGARALVPGLRGTN